MINGHWQDDCYIPEPTVQRFEAELGRLLAARPCDGCGEPLGSEPRRMLNRHQYHPRCAGVR